MKRGVHMSERPGLSVSAVARRLGVAPSTLRTWERRYGLGPTGREGNGPRRYFALDVARLERMQSLIRSGVPTGDAARAVQEHDEVPPGQPPELSAAAAADGGAGPGTGTGAGPGTGTGAGPADAAADAARLVRGLTRACLALDDETCTRLLRGSTAMRGVSWTWQQVLLPVLMARGRYWARTGQGVEVEHLLSSVTAAEFSSLAALDNPINSRPVLLACAPWDDHTLALHAVAAALAERRIATRMLGARTPASALAAAVRRVGPSSVLVWASIAGEGASWLTSLVDQRPAPAMFIAGPGWGPELPAGLQRFDDLDAAVAGLTSRST